MFACGLGIYRASIIEEGFEIVSKKFHSQTKNFLNRPLLSYKMAKIENGLRSSPFWRVHLNSEMFYSYLLMFSESSRLPMK